MLYEVITVPEARTGDLNYVNKKYVRADETKAVEDLARTLPFGDDYRALHNEFAEKRTREALLAHDRITSYNVCYTKLLRVAHTQLPIELPAYWQSLVVDTAGVADPGERVAQISTGFLGNPYVADTLVGGANLPEQLA